MKKTLKMSKPEETLSGVKSPALRSAGKLYFKTSFEQTTHIK